MATTSSLFNKKEERYDRIATHIPDTQLCMIVLPCKYAGKALQITVNELKMTGEE